MEGRVEYFDIKDFGFFLRGKDEVSFSTRQEIMDNFLDWINGRPNLENTKAVKADKANGEMNVYCFDKDSRDGDYIIVLWNEMSNAENEILAVSKASKLGEAEAKSGFNSDTQIPGLPSYYWVSLKGEFVATIYFDHGTTSITNFKNYVTNYVQNHSGYAVTGKHGQVIGFKENEDAPLSTFKFELTRRMDESSIERLQQNFTKINKLVRRSKIESTNPVDSGFIKRQLKGLGEKLMRKNLERNQEASIDFEFDFGVSSVADLNEMIADYGNTINEGSRHNDMGFKLKGENRAIYLSGERLKKNHDFAIIRKGRNPFTANQLLTHIERHKMRLNPPKKVEGNAA